MLKCWSPQPKKKKANRLTVHGKHRKRQRRSCRGSPRKCFSISQYPIADPHYRDSERLCDNLLHRPDHHPALRRRRLNDREELHMFGESLGKWTDRISDTTSAACTLEFRSSRSLWHDVAGCWGIPLHWCWDEFGTSQSLLPTSIDHRRRQWVTRCVM